MTILPAALSQVVSTSPVDLQLVAYELYNLISATAGDVTGPAGAVSGDVAQFADATGKVLSDAGYLASAVARGPASAVSGNLPSFNGTGGKVLQDSLVPAANVVQGPASAVNGNLCVFDTTSGKLIKDGGAPASGGLVQYSSATRTAGDLTTSSTSFVDATGMSVTITTGAHRCLITVNANCQVPVSGVLSVDIDIDGTRQGQTLGLNIAGNSVPTIIESVSFSFMTAVLSAASHTFKLQWKVNGGTGTLFAATTSTPLIIGVTETNLTT